MKLITRDQFREQVFDRDDHLCVVCHLSGVDAHHILDRKLFSDGGYYLDNGATVCKDCHIKAEQNMISPDTLRRLIGIRTAVLPPQFDPRQSYDKWGNVVIENREQKLIDIMFELALTLTDAKYKKQFGKKKREEIATYVTEQLRACGFDTQPMGASWGVLKK